MRAATHVAINSYWESCEVQMLQRKRPLPVVSDTRLVRLSRTVWTQLTHNIWTYFDSRSEVVTMLC